MEELRDHRPSLTSSPGPDGITARQLRAMPRCILAIVINLILWCRRLPEHLRKSATVFIPKKAESNEPGDFRPITIPSVITRQINTILASRIKEKFNFDGRQRAFLNTDGCADNTIILDMLIKSQHASHSRCYMAALDVGKAFDSVSHQALWSSLKSYGFPQDFVNYMEQMYSDSTTILRADTWQTGAIHPRVGVKQGDPLSPLMFNIIIDRLLRQLPNEIGAFVGTTKLNALAFADDLVVAASTPEGLQSLLDNTTSFLETCGLSLNAAKCISISIVGQPKQKKTIIRQLEFKVHGRPIPALKSTDRFRYLGIYFSPTGKNSFSPQEVLMPMLENLRKAPLKPQQRLHALRCYAIPRLYHQLTLADVKIGCLRKTDQCIRRTVRSWLDLPHDVPSSYIHAPVREGGLGIPSIRWRAPLLRRRRLLNLNLPSLENTTAANFYIAKEIDKTETRLTRNNQRLLRKIDLENMWARELHGMVDGRNLAEAGKLPSTHRWVREPTRLLSGRDFINCIKFCINAIATRSRTARGRPDKDRSCRAGCSAVETSDHVLQKCHRTHASRIKRHDAIVAYLQRNMVKHGYDTTREPRLQLNTTHCIPDLVAVKDGTCNIVDVQIVTDSITLDAAHRNKKGKYDTVAVKTAAMQRFAATNVTVTSLTINWRGVISQQSIKDLQRLQLIRNHELALLSTRTLIGSIATFRQFVRDTSTRRRRPPR